MKDLSLEVRPGEIYTLLGTNGAGKSSTLEVVEGHRRPTSHDPGLGRLRRHPPPPRLTLLRGQGVR
ncbi:ATP-binding cassette domain-containing protein [Micromonospora sp. B9E7]|uniref:ATP-binding cassette domain-containing protein n=1 Tax=Micromonospora sp. B9E7 TaxID=3153574 RepID=UPI00325C7F0E